MKQETLLLINSCALIALVEDKENTFNRTLEQQSSVQYGA